MANNDPKYRLYLQQVDKALKAFEGTSRWPDLVYALSRLIKVLESNSKYQVIPSKLLVGQRLAQCMHPELPSGVHLKALETYDLIFKIIGSHNLVQELPIYSNGLFPLLSQASINVKPELLRIYESHFATLGQKLKPALDGFLIAVLPGLEEGSDHHNTTDILLKKVCDGVGKTYFYGSLWRCILIDSSIRLPAVSFILSHFVKKKSLEDQLYIMGTCIDTFVYALCASLLDQNVLVQRAVLDLLLDCFPMHNKQISPSDMISVTTAALTVLLRRDISLNRRLDGWLFGLDSNGQSYLTSSSALRNLGENKKTSSSTSGSRTRRRRELFYTNYSKDIVYQALVRCLGGPKALIPLPNAWSSLGDKWGYSLIIYLLGIQDIIKPILDMLCIDIFRSVYKDIRKDKVEPDMLRTCNLLLTNLKMDFLWKRLYDFLDEACNNKASQFKDSQSLSSSFTNSQRTYNSYSCSYSSTHSTSSYNSNHQTHEKNSTFNPDIAANNPLNRVQSPNGHYVQPVGSQNTPILEIICLMDFMVDINSHESDSNASKCYQDALYYLLDSLTKFCIYLKPDEIDLAVRLCCKLATKVQPTSQLEPLKTVPKDRDALSDIKEETDSLCLSEITVRLDDVSSLGGPDKVKNFEDNVNDEDKEHQIRHHLTYTEELVERVTNLFSIIVHLCLVENSADLENCFEQFITFDRGQMMATLPQPLTLRLRPGVVPIYVDLCQLIVKTALVQKFAEEMEIDSSSSPQPPRCRISSLSSPSTIQPPNHLIIDGTDFTGLGKWLKDLLSLSFAIDRTHVRARYCSISTVLDLISIHKSRFYEIPLPANLTTFTQSSSPVLDFNKSATVTSNASESGLPASVSPECKLIPSDLCIEDMLSSDQLQYIYNQTDYFIKITSELWDDLKDDNSEMHLETAIVMQRVHNLAQDSSVCESVICSAMASSDELVSYEARKRFCILFSITRDLRQKSPQFANMREFDRPLFFMLDSLTHKLDAHNTLALDWLNQCLKNGDIARILEPLLFILLHPDTNRVSVQHVHEQQLQDSSKPDSQRASDNISTRSAPETSAVDNSNTRSDEADTASEAKIYAISSTGGNIIYHLNPEGKKRFQASSAPSNKVLALTSQNNQATSKSASSNKWVTSKFHFPEYQVPLSCDPNVSAGKHLSINMFLNPFGSISSLNSEAEAENNPLSLISTHTENFNTGNKKIFSSGGGGSGIKLTLDMKRTPTPTPTSTPTPISTPIPYRASKLSMEENDSGIDSEIANLLNEIIDTVVSRVEEEDDESRSSSSSSGTTTRQTISESISLTNWIKPVSVNHLHSHILLYTQVYDSRRTLYALTTLWNIIISDPQVVLFKMATTSISNRLGNRSQELQMLCARHRKSILGRSFYGDVDNESVTAFRSSPFLEVIVTTCLYYIRSFYPSLPHSRLNDDEIQGNQKVRILSCEILRLIFSELVTSIKRIPNLSGYLNDMLMRCKSQKVILHEVVSSVYNFQQRNENKNSSNNSNIHNNNNSINSQDKCDPSSAPPGETFPDTIVDFNEKIGSSGFQEDMQKSILKLLEQLMILEHKVSPAATQNEKDMPTHNRKENDSRASRIRFQPQMSALKYCPNALIPSQSMFLSAIQTALQQTHKANLHANWLSLVEATLPYAGRSLTRLVVCVITQLCHNLENIASKIKSFSKQEDKTTNGTVTDEFDMITMPPNYLTILLKSLSTLCHYCLLDSSNSSSNTLNSLPQTSSISTSASSSTTTGPLQVLSNIFNAFSSIDGLSDINQNRDNQSINSSDPLISSRRTVLSHLHRILTAILAVWKVVSTVDETASASSFSSSSPLSYSSHSSTQSSFPSDSTEFCGWQIMGTAKDVKKDILSLLSPVSIVHGNNFMSAIATVWYDLRDAKITSDQKAKSVIPTCSQDQLLLVNLVAAIRILPMESVLQTVRHVIKQPPYSLYSRKKSVPIEVSILQFLLAYIKVFPGSQLLECWKSLHTLLRDGLQITSFSPVAQFHLLAILHEFILTAPLFEDRKDQKDLQEVAQKLVEACTSVAAARLSQTKWLRKNLEVRPGPQHDAVEEDGDAYFREPSLLKVNSSSVSGIGSSDSSSSNPDGDPILARYSVQALNALAQFVAAILDVVYISEEKEKVVPLVSNIISYVTPYLRNHSKNNVPSFRACSHLLSSISGYQYCRKAWRKDALELLMDSAFFQMEPSCLSYWKIIVDHLMTHDKTSFRDFLSRMSVNQSGSLKIFSSKDQELESRAQLAKRLAFILYCSEKDQYQKYMPEIQEKLIEALRVNSSPVLQANILICFRVLITRMSSYCLTSLWPFIYTEMCQVFLQIESELNPDGTELRKNASSSGLLRLSGSENSWTSNGSTLGLATNPGNLQLYLQACKLLDLALSLPTDYLPQFQMHRWGFVSNNLLEADPSRTGFAGDLNCDSIEDFSDPSQSKLLFEPIAVRIERFMRIKNPNLEIVDVKFKCPFLDFSSINSILDLHPFFYVLVKSHGAENSLLSKSRSTQSGVDRMNNFSNPSFVESATFADQSSVIDRIFEMDFLESIPN